MIVLKSPQDKVLSVLESVAGIVERRYSMPVKTLRPAISNGFPEQGGGGASAEVDCDGSGASSEAPAVAASDDDGNSEEGDPDRRRRTHACKTKSGAVKRSPLINKRRDGAVNPMTPYTFDFDDLPDGAFIREAQMVQSPKRPGVPAPLPFSAPTLWRKVKAGTFPKPVKLSDRVTAWKVGTVRAWINTQSGE